MKKLLALPLAILLVVSLAACGSGADEPADDSWTKQVVVSYFFEETGQDVEMTIKTNNSQSKYNFTFLFFGDPQDMTCTADGEVLEDLTGFIGKDAQNYLDYIAENIADSDWQTIN